MPRTFREYLEEKLGDDEFALEFAEASRQTAKEIIRHNRKVRLRCWFKRLWGRMRGIGERGMRWLIGH